MGQQKFGCKIEFYFAQCFADVQALNLGRSYFAVGNFPKAMEYYAKVSRPLTGVVFFLN